MKYCTYLTIYKGTKLPSRYIGSTSVAKIKSGYNGSIKSKRYKDIYLAEQKDNKHLFKTRILSVFNTREEALDAEKELQIKYMVHKSKDYMNMAIAVPNGYFGRDLTKEDHPFFMKQHTDETRQKISETLKKRYDNGELKSPFCDLDNKGEKNPFYGKSHTEEAKSKMRKPKSQTPKWPHPETGKLYDAGNLTQKLKREGWTIERIKEYRNKVGSTKS